LHRETPRRLSSIRRHADARAAFAAQEVTMLDFMRIGGFNMWFLTVIGAVMLVTAIKFARSADPQRLSILRALTFAIIVAGFTGFFSGLIKVFLATGDGPGAFVDRLPPMVAGIGESCANLVLAGAFAVVTWILVAVGVRRMPGDAL
jgi:hypothetical protein